MSLLPIAGHKQQADGTPFRFVDEEYGIDCACGFTVTTPHGKEDAIAVAQDHVQRIQTWHPPERPSSLSLRRGRGTKPYL